ncbi:hypothetical protein C8F04DRAFT_246104 [Mycena alexandri]|uniref:Uncharacterized protein n=1 Tax=Mycena alexandri TaxID=1745969 RepID=A0AAD6WSM0_9AGAR|nr:hypothetical protein C8F04DRAFT_246104 [Mycena alexandri]
MLVQFVSFLSLAASQAQALTTPAQAATSLGYLKATSDGKVIGYISKTLNANGEFEGVSPDKDSNDVAHRMLVSIDQSVTGPQSLVVENLAAADADWPFLGGIGGVNGTTIGSAGNYLLIGGTTQTLPGNPALRCGNTFTDRTGEQRNCASAFWVYNATTSAVTPQWTNDDGSVVVGDIGFVNEAFIITGGIEQFEAVWEDKVEWLNLTLQTS